MTVGKEVKRSVIKSIRSDDDRDKVLMGILNALGYELIEYQEEGEEVETSHGRSYWSEGRKEKKIEKIDEARVLIYDY